MSENFVFVGCYASPAAPGGIHRFRQDLATGHLEPAGLATATEEPSFLVFSPDGRRLFAVGELEPEDAGFVASYGLEQPELPPRLISRQLAGGGLPCHLCMSPDASRLFSANYGGGTAAMFRIAADGCLEAACALVRHGGRGPHPERQEKPHPHSVTLSPDGAFLAVADLGIDRLRIYRVGAGALTPHGEFATAPGAGPRHLEFHPDRRHAFLINELNGSMSALSWDAGAGSFREINTVSILPDGFSGENTAADVHVSADGRFVYGTNRGHDSLVACEIAPDTRAIRVLARVPSGGSHPRNFALAPDGRFLYVANMHSDNIVCFSLGADGIPRPTGHMVSVPRPVCVKFCPNRRG